MANFLNANGLGQFGAKISKCVNEYAVICACKPELKNAKLIECNRAYLETIQILMCNKPAVFNNLRENTLEFRNNGQIISIITR